jgi:twinkle protein
LTRPKDGPPHEEGGRVKQTQFRGSNAIGMWSHFMFGLERNTQGEDEESRITTFRVIKDRNTGQATGKTLPLGYDTATGLLFDTEAFAPEETAEEAYGF